MNWRALCLALIATLPSAATSTEILPSGTTFLNQGLQALAADAGANPGMLWVADGERGGAGRASRGEEARKPPREADLLARPHEDFLVFFLERKVHGLRWEVPHAVGQVAAPQRRRALISDDGLGRAQHAIVTFSRLQYDFHAFQGRADRLREAAAAAAQDQVLRELGGAGATSSQQ